MNYFYENRSHMLDDNIPLSIYLNTDFNFMAHWHTEFELAYVESGSIYVGINNDRRKLSAGDVVLITGGDIHYYESSDPLSRIILLVFKPEFFDLDADWTHAYKLSSSFFKNGDKIKKLLYSILEEKQSKKDFYELFIKAKVIELCASILRYFPNRNSNFKDANKNFSRLKTMQDILIYIENNFAQDISLKFLSDMFNINSFNLSKIFNSVTGCNLRTYINNLRVSKAESIILNSNKPLIDIAVECGFNSIRTFNRAYKAVKGYAPSSIRK